MRVALTLLAWLLVADSRLLQQDGDDRYQTLVAVIGHHGTCQPSCSEQRILSVPQNVFYKVKIEVAQVDMHSNDEQVKVKVGSQEVTCSPRVASDYNCSLVECSQLNFGRVVNSQLRIQVEATKTRDTCKCTVHDGDVDCYSELLSGLDPTYGALVRLSFEPQVRAEWVLGDWSTCSDMACITPGREAERSVQCRIYDPDDVGDGGSRCSSPKPAASRPCAEAPECQPPPPCDHCFYIAHLSDVGMNWSAIVMRPSGANDVQVGETGQPMHLQLLLGLAHVSCDATLLKLEKDVAATTVCVSLAKCDDRGRLLTWTGASDSELGGFKDLVLAEDDGSPKFRMSATFHLRQVGTAGYILANPYSQVDRGTPSFSLVQDLPSYIASSQMQQISELYNETCAVDRWSLVPPKIVCQEADNTSFTCPDEDGAFGHCCLPAECPSGASPADCESQSTNGRRKSVAYVTAGRCEDIRCSAIEDGKECQQAAAALRLARKAKVNLRLSDLVTRFCSWEYGTPDTGSPILWLNRNATSTTASLKNPQLCRCGEARPLRRYLWRVAGWSPCSRSCGKQRRYRKVNCHELIGFASTDPDYSGEGSVVVPSLKCREAGLEEPTSSEPCSTPECWKAEEHTRCAGSNRILDPSDLDENSGAWLVMNRNDTGPTYCVAMNASSVAAVAASVVPELMVTTATAPSFEHLDLGAATELCRKICSQLGSCVGFTIFDHVFGDPNVAQCCFLRRATRWQPNFRRATCHLARGAQTRSGCFCQVGWEIDGGRPSVCGPQRGGCCTTPDNGAVSWCPTTSPSCGTQLQNQQHTDICDLRDVAAVSEHTCRSHPGIRERQCASARGISECNQIATVLGLPDTIPEVELAMNMPSGCVWQRATSKLWLNQLVDAVNASDPSKKVTMSASEEMSELCLCMPTEEYYWEVGEWRPCFRSQNANCHGARERTRSVHCVRADTLETWRYQVVPDAKCSAPRPESVSACTECDRQVIAAVGEFNMPEPVAGLQASNLAAMCSRNLAAAVGIDDSDRISVGQVDCCASSVVRVEILITDGTPGSQSAAAVIDDVMRISRSNHAWSEEVRWIDQPFENMMQYFSLSIRGTYSWEVSDSWGPCSEACGGGVQTREVWCSWTNHEDEAMLAENRNCHAPSRPEHQRSCSSRPCRSCPSFQIGPQYVVSGGDNKVYVTCAAGYESVDDIRLVESECKDGEWTPLAVSCGRSCPDFAAASWKYNVTGSGNLHGSTRQITCKRSETSDNSVEVAVSASVICQDGSWTTPSLVCTGDCLTPELTSAYAVSQINGTSGDNVAQRGTVWQISCAPGFSAREDQTSVKLECERGSWSGLKDIPDCKADCPRYKLSEGYEIVGDEDAQRVVAWDQWQWQEEDGSQDRRLLNITGVNHGTTIGIRCVEGYGRVPGAVERVECNDGQWSPLSLSCSKDCRPFNTSILEFSRFRIMMDPIMDDSAPSQADAPHGSKIIIGCKIDEDKDIESMKRGEVTCDNGRWIPSDFRCFHDCRPFVPGPAYSALIPGALASQRNRSVPHGTQLLATCAQGFSALPSLPPNSSSGGGAERRITPSELIAESECVDGYWTDITLQCFPDCPSWPMRQRMVMDSGGGLRVGSLLRLACASNSKPDVAIRCGMHGTWEVLTEDSDSEGRNLKFLVGEAVTAEDFVKMCPSFKHRDVRDVLEKMTFWSKLSDDERAMFMILTLGCLGSLCGLACTYFLSPYAAEEPPEDEALGDSEATHQSEETAEPPGLRRFNLLTGEVERRRSGRRKRSAAYRLSKFAQRSASRLAGYLKDANPQATSCANCDRAATHVCFPCSHLCLCLSCAEDFLQSLNGPGFQELANQRMAPQEDGMDIIEGQPSCPLCGQFVFCVIDAKPAKVFELPGPLDLALTAASAAATSLRRTAAFAAQGARDVANRSGISPTTVGPTTVGRSRDPTITSHL